MNIPPYPPGGIPMVETPTTPPPTDPAPAWWPDWAPTFSPEVAMITAALLGLAVLLLFVVVAVRRRRSTPTDGDPWIRRLVVMVALATPFMLGLTFYGSFYAVEELAAARGVHPSWVPPLAIDGILVLFLLVDLLFARLGTPKPLVQNVTRGFILLTLVANATSGWGDAVAIFLHIPAPLALVVMTEVARQALVDEARKNAGKEPFDPIPFMRWVLDPVGTFTLWRRMILQDVRSYAVALAHEADRRDALAILATLEDEAVPAYLSRRLRVGMDIPDTVARVRTLARVDETAPVSTPAPTAPAPVVDEVDEGTAPASTTAHTAEPVHVDSTWTSTPTPAPVVDEEAPVVDERVDARVDEVTAEPVEPVPADVFDTPAPAPVHTGPAPVVDEVDEASPLVHPTDGVHTDGGWRAPGTHTDDEGQDHEDEDTDPDDDGPRGGGSAVPTPPAGIPVLAGQTTVDEALAQTARVPSVLEDIRTAMDGPTWDDVADTGTKKDKVLAVLWEAGGDATRAAALYQERTGQDVPREIYRQNARGYAWSWHAGITSHLLNIYADTDRVRDVLAHAGVEATHGAVLDTLNTWTDDHPHVVPIRRLTPSGR